MKINWDERGIKPLPLRYRAILKQAIFEGKRQEKITNDYEMSLSFVSEDEILELNNMYRGKKSVTDVLSFEDDVVICLDAAIKQAEEYGHSLERELAFLAVHGFLHLLGYDHETKEDEDIMIKKQEEILTKVGLTR